LDSTIAAFPTLLNAGDAAPLGMTYTDGAISTRPDGPPLAGRWAIIRSLTEYFIDFSVAQTSAVDEVGVFGDLPFARGASNFGHTPKGGRAEQSRNGKWMVLYERQTDCSIDSHRAATARASTASSAAWHTSTVASRPSMGLPWWPLSAPNGTGNP
jgi:ketosteroid isomerase-like protein